MYTISQINRLFRFSSLLLFPRINGADLDDRAFYDVLPSVRSLGDISPDDDTTVAASYRARFGFW